jgi:hypothetical protein
METAHLDNILNQHYNATLEANINKRITELEAKYDKKFKDMEAQFKLQLNLKADLPMLRRTSDDEGPTAMLRTRAEKDDSSDSELEDKKIHKIKTIKKCLGEIDDKLWIITDYTERSLAIFGKSACMALKDSAFKQAGYIKFNSKLEFGPGWIADRNSLERLLAAINLENTKRRTKIEVKIITRDQV